MPTNVETAAQELAREVRDNPLPWTWRRVTSIMSAFSVHQLTHHTRTDISQALHTAGLCRRALDDERRSLSSHQPLPSRPTARSSGRYAGAATPAGVTFWKQGDAGWAETVSADEASGLLLVDIDLSLTAKSGALTGALPTKLRGLDDDALRGVLTPDHRASFKRAAPGKATRQASLFVVTEETLDATDETAAVLTLGLIELAVGRDWIPVASHPTQTYVSGAQRITSSHLCSRRTDTSNRC